VKHGYWQVTNGYSDWPPYYCMLHSRMRYLKSYCKPADDDNYFLYSIPVYNIFPLKLIKITQDFITVYLQHFHY